MVKKQLINLTDDELSKLLEESSNDPKQEADYLLNDIPGFINTYNIKPGDIPFNTNSLYQLYFHWSQAPVIKPTFRSFMGSMLMVASPKGKHTNYYMINQDSLKLTITLKKLIDSRRSKTPKKTKSKNHRNHFQLFLNQNTIKPGSYFIESYVLYYIYDKWQFNNKMKIRLGKNQLYAFFKLEFEFKRVASSKTLYYGVDPIFKDIFSAEVIQQARQLERTNYEKEKK